MANFHSRVAFTIAASMLSACAVEPPQQDEPSVATTDEALSTTHIDDLVASVSNLTVRVPKRFNVPYSGSAAAEFPNGLPLSIGSGLRRVHGGPWLTFVGLTDRGPNGDSPDYLDAAGATHSTKAFLTASFNPELVTIEVLPFFGPTVTSTTRLRLDRAPVNGIPLTDFSPEVALNEQLTAIPASLVGFDTEGIDFDARGNAWLCDEYGPSLIKVNPRSGDILQLLRPGAGLPTILASRQDSRGFEGIAVTPNGKIYGLIQSTLNIKGSTKGKAQFIRMVEYDPKSKTTRMFAYPHDVSEYAKSGDAKLGDLIAVDNEHFLTIEEGKDKNKNFRNVVYAVDISGATDLSGMVLNSGSNLGLDLEYGTLEEVSAQVAMLKKSRVVDLRAYGWLPEKAEGLAMIDHRTLVIANDQDFGVTATMTGDPASTDPTKYVVDSTGALSIGGVASAASYELHAAAAEDQVSQLFVVRLTQTIQTYYTE